jgi:hypothetical protein
MKEATAKKRGKVMTDAETTEHIYKALSYRAQRA